MATNLSLRGKQWILQPDAAAGNPTPLAEKLFAARGLGAPSSAGVFPDMARAVARILRAIEENERIGIFGDYDCDGITGTAQLVRYFRRRGKEPIVRLPHRVRDGYGLQPAQSVWFAEQNVTLLLTVDTGITAMAAVEEAAAYGVDVIITDHHRVQQELPAAYAILHPALSPTHTEPYPSGAGVAHALVAALEGGPWREQEIDTALAMIGTVADLVPLLGGNRTLVLQGLADLQRLQACPLADLRDVTRAATSTDIAFRIAPRINAAGRIDDPMIALRALLDGGEALAALDTLNEQRQAWMQDLYTHALSAHSATESSALLWAASDAYPHGIIGLIAGKLTEAYGKPSCVVTIEEEKCTASLRSPSQYHITEGLARCSHLLMSYGGHAQAAGCSFTLANMDAVQRALHDDVMQHVDLAALQPTVHIDAELQPDTISLPLIRALQVLEPHGQGNPEPRFLLRNVRLDALRFVGADQTHLQCKIRNCKAIGFGLSMYEEHCAQPLDIVCRLGIDTWQGTPQPQIFIEDLRATTLAPSSLPSGTPV